MKPIVAIVLNEHGEPSIRAAGDVTVVWVDEARPNDRVFETLHREPHEALEAFLGPRTGWGHSGDARQERLALQMEHAAHGLRLVDPDKDSAP